MKKIGLLALLLLGGCEPTVKVPQQDSSVSTLSFPKGGTIVYRTVEIDGQEYYASKTNAGYWVIGPKKENK
jgi:hypothetical protein